MSHRMGRALTALIGVATVIAIASSASAITLATKSKTDYTIVVAPNASVPEKRAAYELQAYLKQVTGADFPVKAEGQVAAKASQILVGRSKRADRLVPGVEWDKLGHDGIVIRTAGKDLVLSGGDPRGALYAVYTFLEDTVGIRWWTSSENYIPTKKTLSIPDLDTVYTPKLRYREAYYRDPNENPLFAVRLRLNGHMYNIPAEYGDHYKILGWCHTSYALLPPGTYFGPRPEWYSEINGKRTPDGGQLCWSNEEMRKELTREALKWIAKNPAAGMISISQNDWHGYCQCPKCKAIDAEEGSPSGSLIRSINAIAEEIEKHALFRKALAATKDNPVYLNHVRRAYLEVLWGTIAINLQPGSDLVNQELKFVPGADEAGVRARAKLFGEIMRENGYNKWREDLAYETDKYPY